MTESELLKKYEDEVKQIPEMRNLVSYRCEDAVKIISFLISNYNKSDNDYVLLGVCVAFLKGRCNPAMIKDIINEWKETE